MNVPAQRERGVGHSLDGSAASTATAAAAAAASAAAGSESPATRLIRDIADNVTRVS
jgi:hypothetical protein